MKNPHEHQSQDAKNKVCWMTCIIQLVIQHCFLVTFVGLYTVILHWSCHVGLGVHYMCWFCVNYRSIKISLLLEVMHSFFNKTRIYPSPQENESNTKGFMYFVANLLSDPLLAIKLTTKRASARLGTWRRSPTMQSLSPGTLMRRQRWACRSAKYCELLLLIAFWTCWVYSGLTDEVVDCVYQVTRRLFVLFHYVCWVQKFSLL